MRVFNEFWNRPLILHIADSRAFRYAALAVFGGVAVLLALFMAHGIVGLGYPPTAPFLLSTMAQILISLISFAMALAGRVVTSTRVFFAGSFLTLVVEPFIVTIETLPFNLLLMPAGLAALIVIGGLAFERAVVAAATAIAVANTLVVYISNHGRPGLEGLPLATVVPILCIVIIAAGVGTLLWDKLAATLIRRAENEAARATRLADERETLVRESSHRVKNNLQVISSMLDLQLRELEQSRAREMLTDARNRVSAMAVVHQSLHDAGELDRVDIGEFLAELVDHITGSIGRTGLRAQQEISTPNLEVEPRTLVPLGLVVNELVTNAVLHGLKGVPPERARVGVRLQQDGADSAFVLEVWDNGGALPPGFPGPDGSSLGLSLVEKLVSDQLGGSFTIHGGDYTRAIVRLDSSLFLRNSSHTT
jgi:two-component sensor histidine kinase